MDRRQFLATLGATAVASQVACIPRRGAPTKPQIGLQLYSLRTDARQNVERTLADIAGIGYTDVELLDSFDNFGMKVTRLREVLDQNGLRAPSTHASGTALEKLDAKLDEARVLGLEYFIIASLPISGKPTLDAYRLWADKLNDAGRRAREHGVWIGFHNHAGDLAPIDGKRPYDILLERTDPSFVRFQLDVGNAAMGGVDPLSLLSQYGERYWLFHIKNVPQYRSTDDAELDKGILDIPRIIAGISRRNEKLLFVEQETYPGTPLESVRRDYEYMRLLKND
jgi:sugar phosphate isomerase/epimerase